MTKEEIIQGLYRGDSRAIKEAIKALEQQSEDCVSRQAVLDLATTIQTDDYSGNEIIDVVDIEDIKALPPITPTQRWMPVSERLPENEEDVLLSVNGDVLKGYFKFDETCYDSGFEDLDETGWYDEHDEFLYNQDIDAWQPLPKPYEEKRGDSDGSN